MRPERNAEPRFRPYRVDLILPYEREMADREGVYGNYYYVIDGKLTKLESSVFAKLKRYNVGSLKRYIDADTVRLCDMVKRGLRPRVNR